MSAIRFYPVIPDVGYRWTVNANSSLVFTVEQLPLMFTFILFQAHAFRGKQLSIEDFDRNSRFTSDNDSSFYGSDVALVKELNDDVTKASCIVTNLDCCAEVTIFFIAAAYSQSNPTPGGCAIEGVNSIDPTLKSFLSPGLTSLKFELALANAGYSRVAGEHRCDDSALFAQLRYELYGLFLSKEVVISEDAYLAVFDASFKSISIGFGTKMCDAISSLRPEFFIGNWPGRPILYTVIVRNITSDSLDYAAYVSVIETGCSNQTVCSDTGPLAAWLFLGVVAVIGLFLVFGGHYFFKSEQFLIGIAAFGLLSYILITKFTNLNFTGSIAFSILIGLFGGVVWFFIWWFFGSPIFHVLMALLELGFLIASIFAYFLLDSWEVFQTSYVNYVLIFPSIQIVTGALLLYWTKLANVLSCAVLGAYAFMCVVSVYFEGSLHYIFERAVRKFSTRDLETACFLYPWSVTDTMLCLAWTVLIVIGVSLQFRITQNHAPFPACPYRTGMHKRVLGRISNYCRRLRTTAFRSIHRSRSPLLRPNNASFSYGSIDEATSSAQGVVEA